MINVYTVEGKEIYEVRIDTDKDNCEGYYLGITFTILEARQILEILPKVISQAVEKSNEKIDERIREEQTKIDELKEKIKTLKPIK